MKSGETNSPETMSVCAGIDNSIQSEIGITFTRLLSGEFSMGASPIVGANFLFAYHEQA